jgi:hypothetical protein
MEPPRALGLPFQGNLQGVSGEWHLPGVVTLVEANAAPSLEIDGGNYLNRALTSPSSRRASTAENQAAPMRLHPAYRLMLANFFQGLAL